MNRGTCARCRAPIWLEGSRKFCSRRCRKAHWSDSNRTPPRVMGSQARCEGCGSTFTRNRGPAARFCGSKCRWRNWNAGLTAETKKRRSAAIVAHRSKISRAKRGGDWCLVCRTIVSQPARGSPRRYCSHKCKLTAMRLRVKTHRAELRRSYVLAVLARTTPNARFPESIILLKQAQMKLTRSLKGKK